MKIKKTLFTLSSLMLLMSLTACNNGTNKDYGAKSDATTSSQTTSSGNNSSGGNSSSDADTSSSSDGGSTVNPTVLPSLNVILYNKFVSSEQSEALKSAFNALLTESNVQITNLVWTVDVTGNAKALNDAIETYNGAHADAKYDVILGGKAWTDECTYLNGNYSVVMNAEDTPIEMTIGDKTDRRVWTLKESPNEAAIKLLVKSTLDYDIPETDPGTDVPPDPGTPDTVLDELNVVLYQKFVTSEQSTTLKNAFLQYLADNSIGITNLVWTLDVTGNAKALNDAVESYNGAHADAKYDVILGGKAWTDNCTYLSANYTSVKDAEDTPIEMTIGDKTDRRVWILNDTDNPQAVNELVKHLLGVDLA